MVAHFPLILTVLMMLCAESISSEGVLYVISPDNQLIGDSFSEEAWAKNADIYTAITSLPFFYEMCHNSLAYEKFKQFMIQDIHWVNTYRSVVALAVSKADTEEQMRFFLKKANKTVDAGEKYMEAYNITAAEMAANPPSAVCHHFNSFLEATAYKEAFPG